MVIENKFDTMQSEIAVAKDFPKLYSWKTCQVSNLFISVLFRLNLTVLRFLLFNVKSRMMVTFVKRSVLTGVK